VGIEGGVSEAALTHHGVGMRLKRHSRAQAHWAIARYDGREIVMEFGIGELEENRGDMPSLDELGPEMRRVTALEHGVTVALPLRSIATYFNTAP
jgi:hypothetical protein